MAEQSMVNVYVGTYTGETGSEGIHLYQLDTESGRLSAAGCAAAVVNPSFLTLDASGRHLYAVNEMAFPSPTGGGASAFRIAPDGSLELLGQQPAGGEAPCHLSVDRSGRWLLLASYGSGTLSALPIDQQGRIGPPARTLQHETAGTGSELRKPHAHCVVPAADGRHVFVVDLGLDALMRYELDAESGQLEPASPARIARPRGSEPRMLSFHPSLRYAYLMHEASSTLSVYNYDAQSAAFSELQTLSTLPEGWQGTSYGSEVQAAPSGRFVYAANRGHDSIAVLSVDQQSGRLTPIQHCPSEGHFPRHFAIDPSGRYLLVANQKGNTLTLLQIDQQSGKLSSTGQVLTQGAPVCVLFAGGQAAL